MNYSRDYVKGHETQYLDQIAVILVPKSPGANRFSNLNGLFNLGRKIEAEIVKMRVNSKDGPITFHDICARSRSSLGQRCQTNDILKLKDEVKKFYCSLKLSKNVSNKKLVKSLRLFTFMIFFNITQDILTNFLFFPH